MAGRLLVIAGMLFLMLVALSIAGERTLPLFAGDRDLAQRVYKTVYVLIGAGAFGLAIPALVTVLAERLRALFLQIDAQGSVAALFLSDRAVGHAQAIGYGLMVLFIAAGAVASLLVWLGIMWPAQR